MEATQPNDTAAPQAAPAAAPEPTGLDKVYSDFKIEADAASFHPQPNEPAQPVAQPVPQQPAPFKVPDPFDPGFAEYQARMAQGVSALTQRTTEALQKLNAIEQRAQRAAVEADIKSAVGKIAEKSGIDPEIAEVAFEAQARKDPRLLAIWNNRARNPKALDAAISALSGEFAQRYAVKQDPQLVENQRAVAASRNQMATTQVKSENDRWAEMTPREREAERDRIRRGG